MAYDRLVDFRNNPHRRWEDVRTVTAHERARVFEIKLLLMDVLKALDPHKNNGQDGGEEEGHRYMVFEDLIPTQAPPDAFDPREIARVLTDLVRQCPHVSLKLTAKQRKLIYSITKDPGGAMTAMRKAIGPIMTIRGIKNDLAIVDDTRVAKPFV